MHRRVKIRRIKYKKERAILSDVLPYEIPIIFTNRYFYDFLKKFKIRYEEGKISWQKDSDALDKIIHILFALPEDADRLSCDSEDTGVKSYDCRSKNGYSSKVENALIPFGYKINHKQKEFRDLYVPHPRSQLVVSDFYEQYKESIFYYCSQSSFSIRVPWKVATHQYYRNNRKNSELSKEYKNQRSFFSYKDYSNVHKFYESYRYHRCEKKYNRLLTLDIAKCFDSIYTHSIAWAILGKQQVKENLRSVKDTFAGRFDKLMQNINYGETNGIIIGPEFPRIFAEVILQDVDKKIERDLKKNHSLKNKVDYEMFRYVDDYFIFYNEAQDRNIIVETSKHVLKEYKLHFNTAKEIEYEKPIITEMSIAKERISNLMEDKLTYKLEKVAEDGEAEEEEMEKAIEEDEEKGIKYKGSIYVNETKLIVDFKTIIKECGIEYKDILSYSFSIIENKCQEIIEDYKKADPDFRSGESLIKAIINILEFVFFIYSVSPKVNITIKLCRVLDTFMEFLKDPEFCNEKNHQDIRMENKHIVFKFISDNIRPVLKKNKYSDFTQVETLYLLIALSELGKEYCLEEDVLAEYFGMICYEKGSSEKYKKVLTENKNLNYFSLIVVLFCMRKNNKYNKLRDLIESIIIKKFTECEEKVRRKKTENTLLFFDMLSCPFIGKNTKRNILESYGIEDHAIQDEIINFQSDKKLKKVWFVKWEDFNFGKELDAKRSQEVY